MSDKVYIERPEVTAEREAGWVNFHPEDICHACGGDNPRWHADPEQWYQAMDVRDTDAGGIVCPHCFIALWHDTTDREVIWHLSIMEVTSSDIGPTSSDIERDSEGVGDCAPLPCEKRYEMCAKPLPTWPPGQSICSAPSKRAL